MAPSRPTAADPLWGRLEAPPSGLPATGECHLWPVPVESGADRLNLLDDDERRRLERIRVDGAREVFVASRAAQRLIGGHYLGRASQDVAIDRTCAHCGADHGRPRLVGAALDYSVSHARGWVLIAVVGRGLVGVDLESALDPKTEELAPSHVLAPVEQRLLAGRGDRGAFLLRAWTRKEAVVKLTGHGLAVDLRTIDVSGPVAVAASPPDGWPRNAIRLLDVPVGGDLRVALASTVALRAVTRWRPAFA